MSIQNEIYVCCADLLNLSEEQLKELSAKEYCERQAPLAEKLKASFEKAGVTNYWISVDHWSQYNDFHNHDQTAYEFVRLRLISVFSDVYKEAYNTRPRWESYPESLSEIRDLINKYSEEA